jgi:outer membrane receptor for ferric coprogen and ferric-rhodotorulic acid
LVSTTRSAGYNADIWLSCSVTEQVDDPPFCAPPNHALTTARKDDVVSILTTAKTSAGTYHVVVRASDANGLTASNGDQTVSFTLTAGGAPITYSEVIQGTSVVSHK